MRLSFRVRRSAVVQKWSALCSLPRTCAAPALSGGRTQLVGISRRGNKYMRKLLILGGHSTLRHLKDKKDRRSQWARQVASRRGRCLATIALANKNARIAWSLLRHGSKYQSVSERIAALPEGSWFEPQDTPKRRFAPLQQDLREERESLCTITSRFIVAHCLRVNILSPFSSGQATCLEQSGVDGRVGFLTAHANRAAQGPVAPPPSPSSECQDMHQSGICIV